MVLPVLGLGRIQRSFAGRSRRGKKTIHWGARSLSLAAAPKYVLKLPAGLLIPAPRQQHSLRANPRLKVLCVGQRTHGIPNTELAFAAA
jgi:hypothetical protein